MNFLLVEIILQIGQTKMSRFFEKYCNKFQYFDAKTSKNGESESKL